MRVIRAHVHPHKTEMRVLFGVGKPLWCEHDGGGDCDVISWTRDALIPFTATVPSSLLGSKLHKYVSEVDSKIVTLCTEGSCRGGNYCCSLLRSWFQLLEFVDSSEHERRMRYKHRTVFGSVRLESRGNPRLGGLFVLAEHVCFLFQSQLLAFVRVDLR